jgi:hypothetical protein
MGSAIPGIQALHALLTRSFAFAIIRGTAAETLLAPFLTVSAAIADHKLRPGNDTTNRPTGR